MQNKLIFSGYRLRLLIVGFTIGAWMSAGAHADLVIGKKGGNDIRIVVADQGSPTQLYAAKELQEAIRGVTDVDLPIIHGLSQQGGKRIVIGQIGQVGENLPLRLKGEGDDELLVQRVGEALYLTGATDRAALYATYAFLEECVGMRWLWPGESGTVYPKAERLEVGNVHLQQSPSIPFRTLAINAPHYDDDTQTWLARQRLNIDGIQPGYPKRYFERARERGFLVRIAGHHVTLPETLLDQHPDWRALYGGVRRPHSVESSHLCWSNPEVQEALKEKLAGWVKDNPEIDIVSLYTADHNQFCRCEACHKMAPDVSTRWQLLSRELIAAIREVSPKVLITTLAYQAYRAVPDVVAPYDNVGYTTYNISYRYPLSSGYRGNDQTLKEIAGWQKHGAKMGLRGYEMIIAVEPRAAVPQVYLLLDEMRYAVAQGWNSFSTEVAPYGFPKKSPPHEQGWNVNRLNLYAAVKAMWNAEISQEQLLDDWCAHAYGAAASPMKQYYKAMERAWRETPGDVSYFLNPSPSIAGVYMTDALLSETEALLAAAAEAAKAEPRHAAAVALDRAMWGTWERLYRQQQASALRTSASALQVEQGGAPEALPWERARKFSRFVDKEGNPVEDDTDVQALWNNTHFYLRIYCHDAEPARRVAIRREHDDSIWSDDSVELFINRAVAGYDHLAVNSLGTRYEARTEGGMGLDRTFNPEWQARPFSDEKGWGVELTLPFSWLEKTADGAVALSIKRNRPGRTPSGWPDASYHNPSAAGRISLVLEEKPRVLLYDGGRDGAPLMAAMRKAGWSVGRVKQLREGEGRLALDEADIVTLYYGSGGDFRLTDAFFREDLLPFVEGGGVAVIGSSRVVPLERWLGDQDLAVRWSGWEIAPLRRTATLADGGWLQIPNDLRGLFESGVTPSSAFKPVGEGWKVLATLRMANDDELPYLLVKKIGKGAVVLTSSNLGYSGGYEIFGHQNTKNIVKLLENIYRHREELSSHSSPTE